MGRKSTSKDSRWDNELQSLRRMHAEAVTLAQETGYVSDELIADRRAEVVKEAEEDQRWLRECKRKRSL